MNIGFLLFEQVTQLDFTGPLQVLHRAPGATTHIAAKTLAPVGSDCGLGLVPTVTLAACPQLDVLVVPGGFGVAEALAEAETIDFVRAQAAGARFVTSVCTGAFILGAAGLLKGKRATTHWAYHALLPRVGAIPQRARIVRDGEIITGGGVTAGIDFAFALLSDLVGAATARSVQLALEYDPAPPFPFAPEGAEAERVRRFYAQRLPVFSKALDAAIG